MTFKVASDRTVCGKKQGEILTLKELIDAGANIEALIVGGHIVSNQITPKPAQEEGAKK